MSPISARLFARLLVSSDSRAAFFGPAAATAQAILPVLSIMQTFLRQERALLGPAITGRGQHAEDGTLTVRNFTHSSD